MTRNRFSELQADFRTTRTGLGQAAFRARREFATAIGPRWPEATVFTFCSIRPIATRFMRKASRAKYTGSICEMARYAVCGPNRLKASRVIDSIGIHR